jgi:hypothetical protein
MMCTRTDRFGPVVLLLAITTGLASGVTGCGPTNGFPPLTGEFLYVSSANAGNIYELSIDTSTGLSQM